MNINDYSFYVWGSYGVAALIFVVEIWLVQQRRKNALRDLRLERTVEDGE